MHTERDDGDLVDHAWLLALLGRGDEGDAAPPAEATWPRRLEGPEAAARWRGVRRGEWAVVESAVLGSFHCVRVRPVEPGRGAGQLTPREREVARLAASGMRIKQVAEVLGVSSSTVGTHLAAAMRKYGVRTRGELSALLG